MSDKEKSNDAGEATGVSQSEMRQAKLIEARIAKVRREASQRRAMQAKIVDQAVQIRELTMQLEKSDSNLIVLSDRYQQRSQQVREFVDRDAGLRKKLKAACENWKKSHGQYERLRDVLAEKEKLVAHVKKQCEQRVQSLQDEGVQREQRLDSLQQQVLSLKSELNKAKVDTANARMTMETSKVDWLRQQDVLEKQLEQLRKQLTEVDAHRRQLMEACNNRSASVKSPTPTVTQPSAPAAAPQEESWTSLVTGLFSADGHLPEDVRELRRLCVELKRREKDIEESFVQHTQRMADMQTEMADWKIRAENSEQALFAMKAERDRLASNRKLAYSDVSDMKTALETAQSRLAAVQLERADARARAASLEEEVMKLRGQKKVLVSEVLKLREQLLRS
ncbi:MAG: hypothetical protein MHM6MM_000970 [Cercozoa sp. M6MM]